MQTTFDGFIWRAFEKPIAEVELDQALRAGATVFDPKAVADYKVRQADQHTTVSGWWRYPVAMILCHYEGVWTIFCFLPILAMLASLVGFMSSLVGCLLVSFQALAVVMMGLYLVLAIIFLSIARLCMWLEEELEGEQVARWQVVDLADFKGHVPEDVRLLAEEIRCFLPEAEQRVHVLRTKVVVDPVLEIRHGGHRKFVAIWDGDKRIWEI